MESALGNESEHVADKTSRFAVLDKQKATYEEAAVNKDTKNQSKLGSARTSVSLIEACIYGCRIIKRKSVFFLETIRD